MHESLDIDSAEHDAFAWAMYSSDKGIELIRSSEQRYRAKYELRKQQQFDGALLCEHLSDGEYLFPFLMQEGGIYKNFVNARQQAAGWKINA